MIKGINKLTEEQKNYKNEDDNLYTVDPGEEYNKVVCNKCDNDNGFYIN